MRTREILKNINLLNALLAAVLAAFSAYMLFPLLNIKSDYTLPAAKKTVEKTEEKAAAFQSPSIAEYTLIAEQNPFHPDRKIPVEKTADAPLPKPDFVLYGTMITDSVSIAYIEDMKAPSSTPGRGKRQTALKKGDTMAGFTLKDIETDKIVMARGEEQLIVHLNDPQKPKIRETVVQTTAQRPGQPIVQPIPQTAAGQQQQPIQQQAVAPAEQPANTKQQIPQTRSDAAKTFSDLFRHR